MKGRRALSVFVLLVIVLFVSVPPLLAGDTAVSGAAVSSNAGGSTTIAAAGAGAGAGTAGAGTGAGSGLTTAGVGVTGTGVVAPTVSALTVTGAVAGAVLITGGLSNAGNKTEETPSTPATH